MKKFISLALAAAMTLSLVPVSAFAATDNRITNVVTVEKDDVLNEDTTPTLVIKNDKGDFKAGELEFGLKLDGAEFSEADDGTVEGVTGIVTGGGTGHEADGNVTVKYVSSTSAIVTVDSLVLATDNAKNTAIEITLGDGTVAGKDVKGVKVTGDKATLTIDPRNSVVSADTFTFAKSIDGGAVVTVDGTKDFYDGNEVNDIFIEEVVAGSIKSGDTIKLKLNGGFEFAGTPTVEVISGAGSVSKITVNSRDVDGRDCSFEIGENNLDANKISVIKISGISISEDGADFGDTAEITVSGTNFDKTTLEMGKLVDFGVSISAEDKDLPVIYSGTNFVKSDEDKHETLVLTLKENVIDSWLTSTRKTTFTFPEGVEVVDVDVDGKDNIDTSDTAIEEAIKAGIDNNEITLASGKIAKGTGKAELSLKFYVVTDPEFTGDIKCTVGGPAVSEDTEVTLAKAVSPIAIEAEKTSVAIDYRNVAVGDITVKEAEAGIWAKYDTITLKVDNMQFENGITAEVVEGDGDIEDLSIDKSEGTITIEVKSESSKAPMAIKLSNVSLYLDRSLPAGDYGLSVVGSADKGVANTEYDVMFKNYGKDSENGKFDTDEVEFLKDYVTVATAGRDQGTTFTTNVVVTIDSTTMLVDGKEVTLDVPAYLSAEGWTMLPVRAVTESLASASNSQPVDWIAGNPGTIMIYYGDKTVSMTLGSTTMYINGTPVPMSTAPVIVNDRAFLPMRDLGRALGLSDSQIAWDATARTATFNPVAE